MTETTTARVDGEILVVVFDDPTQARIQTIVLLFGAQATTGDRFAITLAEPIDPASPGALADMGLGIGYGFQGTEQYSIVDVNTERLTTSAGGQDDGAPTNGALITAGGLDDSNDNPADPFALPNGDPRFDDELYSLLPFLELTDTSIVVDTLNPSNDDNILFAYFQLSTSAALGEALLLAPVTDSGAVGTDHTVTARVVDDEGEPVEGREVEFSVESGPNAGDSGSGITNEDGTTTFTYTGDGGTGTDMINAWFVNNAGERQEAESPATMEWTSDSNEPPVALCEVVDVGSCEGGEGPIVVSGEGSLDPEGEPLTYAWTSEECTFDDPAAVQPTATCPVEVLARFQLVVNDGVNDSEPCFTSATVLDDEPPVGGITYPVDPLCTGEPVTVLSDFVDACGGDVELFYDPAGGPTYSDHGDYAVTVTARDQYGNEAADATAFTVDTIAPTVEILQPRYGTAIPTPTAPIAIIFSSADDDGALGDVVWERVLINGCVAYDGWSYGNGDGLLTDEELNTTSDELCRVAHACGFSVLHDPLITVEAYDCAGNGGTDERVWVGKSVSLVPGLCSN
jgi:hypothetical protein